MIKATTEFWKAFKQTKGALSCAESVAIMEVASLAPKGLYCELGTHKGKSTISALVGLKDGVFLLVDPIFNDNDICAGMAELFFKLPFRHVQKVLLADYSTNVIEKHIDYSYVFVDSGSHGDGLPMQEVKMLEDRMVKGGIIAFHDYKNQFVEVEQSYDYLVSTGKYEPIHINWYEIFDYVAEHNLEEGNDSWHLYPELPHPPNFVGALKRK